MSRPLISVYSGVDGKVVGRIQFAGVMQAPVRPDVVHHVHRDISKNTRQPYAVMKGAGHQTSAESWGTGRAVARIPRVPGGGTHRAGQGAFGNMCRGGHMFAPTKVYRRWHRKVNKNQRRFAIVSSLAASASVPLVAARGHRIDNVPEIPLVISNKTISNLEKTKAAVKLLKAINAYADVSKVIRTKKIRAGKGKARNRRYVLRRGPLIIYEEKTSLCKAFRNLPGVDLCCVTRLNLLQLAPGGHVGRFIIWTQSAYERLETLYGTYTKKSTEKIGYTLPRAVVTTSNLTRILRSPEILSLLRKRKKHKRFPRLRKNPLKNLAMMIKLNPYAKTARRNELLKSHPRVKALVAQHDASKQARKEEIAKARARKGLPAPKPAERQPTWKLPVVDYLLKKGKKLNDRLKAIYLRRQGKILTPRQKKRAEKAEEGRRKYLLNGIGRLPGLPSPHGERYVHKALQQFRDQRKRRIEQALRRAKRSIVPTPKPGDKPFVEYQKKRKPKPKPLPKDILSRLILVKKRVEERKKRMEDKRNAIKSGVKPEKVQTNKPKSIYRKPDPNTKAFAKFMLS